MRLKTILNQLEKYRSFVFKDARFCDHYDEWTFGDEVVVIDIEPRANGKPICSGCGRCGPCYDHLDRRLFEYVPLWTFKVFFAYTMRRVDCKRCGVTVEMIPWADGKEQLTRTYKWFLAQWAKRLSFIKENASKAIHVLGLFHIMMHMSKAIDKVRADESCNCKLTVMNHILRRRDSCYSNDQKI